MAWWPVKYANKIALLVVKRAQSEHIAKKNIGERVRVETYAHALSLASGEKNDGDAVIIKITGA